MFGVRGFSEQGHGPELLMSDGRLKSRLFILLETRKKWCHLQAGLRRMHPLGEVTMPLAFASAHGITVPAYTCGAQMGCGYQYHTDTTS